MSRRYHKKSTQLIINDTLTIPRDKPDIEFLLRMTVTPTIDNGAGADRKIIFSGHILICIEYVASVPVDTQPIHFASFKRPFEGMISHRFVRTGINAQLKGIVETLEFELTNPRDIKVSINLKVCSVRLARAYKRLPPNICKPCINVCDL